MSDINAEGDGEMNTGYLIYQAELTSSAGRVRALDAEPVALDQQPAFVWRPIAGGS